MDPIGSYLLFVFKPKKIIFIFIALTSIYVTDALSNTQDETFLDYKTNFLDCYFGVENSPPTNNDETDEQISICYEALKQEKNKIGEFLLRAHIAEYYGFYKFESKFNNSFNKDNIYERIKIYKKALNVLKSIKNEDIDEFNKSKLSREGLKISKVNLKNNRQLNFFRIGELYSQLLDYENSIDYLNKSNEYYTKGNKFSEERFAATNSFLGYVLYKKGKVIEAKNALELNFIDSKCKFKETCLFDKNSLSAIYSELNQFQKAYELIEDISYKSFDFDGNRRDENTLCEFILTVEVNKQNYSLRGINVVPNSENIEFLKGCESNLKGKFYYFYNMATISENNNDYELAIDNLKKAKKVLISNFNQRSNPEIAIFDIRIAYLYEILGEQKNARKFYELGLNSFYSKNNNYSRETNDAKFYFSNFLLKNFSDSKSISIGIDILKSAFEYELLFQQYSLPYLSIDERLRLNDKRLFMDTYNAVFSLSKFLESKGIDAQFGHRLALFNRINFQGIAEEIEKRQNLFVKSNNQVKELYDEIMKLESKMSNIYLDLKEYKKLSRTKEKLEKSLYKKIPALQPKLFSVKEVAKIIPKDSLLIEFQEYRPYLDFKFKKPAYQVLILQPNNEIISIDLGDAKEINQIIKLLNKNIIEGNQEIVDELLFSIYKKIFLPLESYLTNVQTIFISPDSNINLIPFNAIKIGNSQTYLSEIYELNLIANARELIRSLKKDSFKSNNESIVFSNPDFYLDKVNVLDNVDSESKYLRIGNSCKTWNYLEGTIEEGNQIKKLINAKLFTDKEATVNNLKSLDSPPKILHMATHGYFCEDKKFSKHPLVKSGVVLAGANNLDNKGDDDGYLTSLEAAKLNLKNTELVVLSACNTALGDIETGNGVLGLRRALSVAGARSTLLSLWAVDDFATRAFMTSFYQKLKAGNNLRDSLIMTQEDFRNGVIKSDDPFIDWSEEFYWGAFQLSGDSSATLFN